MRSGGFLACMSLGALALVAGGCSGSATPPPPFSDTTGETKSAAAAYPAGPYGLNVGSVIANFQFQGFPNAMGSTAALAPIALADFYNPHGKDASYQPASPDEDDRVFPASSGYAMAGKPKPTVLLVDIASVWCGPCNQEAQELLPFKHDLYAACGGEFMLNLHDSQTPGLTATQTNLKNWTKLYKVDYPAVLDPEFRLDPLFQADAFPNNFIIDTTTMKIVHVVAGEVIPGLCNYTDTGKSCTQNSDCLSQSCDVGNTNQCQDAVCGTTNDLAVCNDATNKLNCGGLAACNASVACTQYDFWTTFESYLDKSRTGCNVK